MNNIDIEKLRNYLINYYGTASTKYPQAIYEVIELENSSEEKVLKLALKNNINLDKFKK